MGPESRMAMERGCRLHACSRLGAMEPWSVISYLPRYFRILHCVARSSLKTCNFLLLLRLLWFSEPIAVKLLF